MHHRAATSGTSSTSVLNRPASATRSTSTSIRELTWWAESAAEDPTLRVAVLVGRGPVFCAGADVDVDVARCSRYTQQENIEDATEMARMFHSLDRLPVPLIGRVHGAALGGGAGLCAVCDIVVAADDAVFGFTEVKLGIMPGRHLAVRAREDRPVGGAGAVPDRGAVLGCAGARHRPRARRRAGRGARRSGRRVRSRAARPSAPEAVAAAKALIPEVARRGPGRGHRRSRPRRLPRQRVSAEGQEGLRAFLEKRHPAWIVKD